MTVPLEGIKWPLVECFFGSHVASRVEAAVALVNALAAAEAGGQVVIPPASSKELRARAAAALARAEAVDAEISTTEAEGLEQLAARLREVFAAVSDQRDDEAAEMLNALLVQSGARRCS